MTTDRIISIDAETNGLSGRAFCVAMTLSDNTGELDNFVRRCGIGDVVTNPWVAQNVLPAIADLPDNCPGGYPQMLAEIGTQIESWGGRDTPLIAHIAWPVEARLLLDVYSGERVWDGPYPLIDVASVLLAHGFDPTTVDGYLRDHGIPTPENSPHHPLYDARAAERCFRHVMATESTTPRSLTWKPAPETPSPWAEWPQISPTAEPRTAAGHPARLTSGETP